MKTVLITGATAGIGEATAVLFAKNGYDVIITGRGKIGWKNYHRNYRKNIRSEFWLYVLMSGIERKLRRPLDL
jgi:NADP-dependent 3-hydroxy acid dehydrogenase YdfG